MTILAIPGKMPATQSWLVDVLNHCELKNQSVNMHRFTAWDSEKTFDIDYETKCLPKGHYDLLITKSIGTLMTLRAQSTLSWDRLIFIGVALSLYSDVDRQLLSDLNEKGLSTLIIQEANDPFGSYQEVQRLVQGQKNITCLEVDGDHHQYTDIDKLGKLINAWLD